MFTVFEERGGGIQTDWNNVDWLEFTFTWGSIIHVVNTELQYSSSKFVIQSVFRFVKNSDFRPYREFPYPMSLSSLYLATGQSWDAENFFYHLSLFFSTQLRTFSIHWLVLKLRYNFEKGISRGSPSDKAQAALRKRHICTGCYRSGKYRWVDDFSPTRGSQLAHRKLLSRPSTCLI